MMKLLLSLLLWMQAMRARDSDYDYNCRYDFGEG